MGICASMARPDLFDLPMLSITISNIDGGLKGLM